MRAGESGIFLSVVLLWASGFVAYSHSSSIDDTRTYCVYVRVVNVYYVRTRVCVGSSCRKQTPGAAKTPPGKHEVTRSAVESEESASMRKGIEHGCCKKHEGKNGGALLSRDAEFFESFQRADVVTRSNATLGAGVPW